MENNSLTRYQLARTFICVIALALVIAWYFNMGRSLFIVKTYRTVGYEGNTFLEMLLSPLLVLLSWPLHGVMARAMVGSRTDEPLTSVRELKSLLWPALGTILSFHALVRIVYDAAQVCGRIAELNRNNYYPGGLLASMLVSNEYSLLDWIFIDGHSFLLDLILLLTGLVTILRGVSRSRRMVEAQSQTTPAKLLTRFQLAHNYIYLVVISFLVYWVLNVSLLLFQYLSGAGTGIGRIVAISPIFILFPLTAALILPFAPPLAHAMCGDESREPVDSSQQLRALFLPCIGLAVLTWSLTGLNADLIRAYNEYRRTSIPPVPVWDRSWRNLAWPIFKLSLGVLWVIYPSLRDMVHQMKSRV